MVYYFVNYKIYLFAYQSTAHCINFLFPRTNLILNFAYLSFVIKTLYNHHKEYLFLACCILYTLICMQFSKNNMVGLNGLEPSTSRLSGVRSNQLSYRPDYAWLVIQVV